MTSVDETPSTVSPSINHDHRMTDVDENSTSHEEVKQDISEVEIISILEAIAATGKFWHDWNILKGLLSYRLKQVWGDYPESQKKPDVGPQAISLSGETYPELAKRLDGALLSFEGGPPFTLQRLCEILLTPKAIYTNLSKLALALEKNLLVTTTLRVSTDPYPSTTAQGLVEPEKADGDEADSMHTENGIYAKCLRDEEMEDAEVGEDDKNMGIATPAEEGFAGTSGADSVSTGSGDTGGGDTGGGDTGGGDTGGGDMGGGETGGGETSGTGTGETAGGETAGGERGGGERGGGERGGGERGGGEMGGGETGGGETGGGETGGGEMGGGETAGGETAGGETAGGETGGGEMGGGEMGGGETVGGDTGRGVSPNSTASVVTSSTDTQCPSLAGGPSPSPAAAVNGAIEQPLK